MTYREFLGVQFNYLMKHGTLDAGFWNRADVIDHRRQRRPRRMTRAEYTSFMTDGPSIGRLTYGND